MLSLSAPGCADLDDYAAGQCGNNVVELEAGEDCDLLPDAALGDGLACGPPDGTAQACRYSCAGTPCPTGWSCGDDQICRPPSGVFDDSDAPDLILGAQEIALRDVMGVGAAQLIARIEGDVFVFAEDDDRLVEAFAASVPNIRGSFSFADFDGEGGVELVVPGGARALGSAGLPRVHVLEGDGERWITAVAPGEAQGEPVVGLATLRGDPTTGDTLLRLTRSGPDASRLAVVAASGCAGVDPDADVLLEGTPATTPQLTSLHESASGLDWISVAWTGDSRVRLVEGEQRCDTTTSCGVGGLGQSCSASLRVAQVLEVGGELGSDGCRFGDFDGDALVDLGCALSDGRLRLAHSDGTAWGAFADLVDDDAVFGGADGQSRSCAPQNALLAVDDLNADGLADLVTPHGVFIATAQGYRRAYARTLGDAWGDAAVGDFDRDGALEIALTVLRDGDSCAPVLLEVLSPTQTAYSSTVVPNASLPEQLQAGDFDGDGIADLGAFERSPEHVNAVVFFGDTKEPLEDKASVDGFEDVGTLLPVLWNEGGSPNPDLVADLAVVSNDGTALTLLQGTTRRAMLSPMAFGAAGAETEHAISALVGALLPGSSAAEAEAASDDGPDDDAVTPDMLITTGTTAWFLSGAAVPDAVDAVALDVSGTGLHSACASWFAGQHRDEATGPLLVGVDGVVSRRAAASPDCLNSGFPQLVLARLDVEGGATVLRTSATATLAGAQSITAVHVLDIDGSGFDDVVVHMTATDTARGTLLWMQDPGVPIGREPPELAEVAPPYDVLAVAPLNANRDPGLELAAVTATGIRIVSWTGSGFNTSEPVLQLPTRSRDGASPITLVSGDSSGDGIADLGLLWGNAIYLYPAVLRP